MKTYYHFYPTCPSCHEPHINGSILRYHKNGLKCSNCGSYFLSTIDFFNTNNFINTIKIICLRDGNYSYRDELKGQPLYWEVNLNPIENEYIDWIVEQENGKYLITWPWEMVKFSPILAAEFLQKYPNKKVVIIDTLQNLNTENEVSVPSVYDTFSNLIFLEHPILYNNDKIDNDINNFNKNFLFLKQVLVNYSISRKGKHYRVEKNCFDRYSSCKKFVINEIQKEFGENSIRMIHEKKLRGDGNKIIFNPDGFIEIVLTEREQRMGNLNYNKKWQWNILLNLHKICYFGKILDSVKIDADININIDEKKLVFLSDDLSHDYIFNVLHTIKPHLVILNNCDRFIRDSIFNGEKSRALYQFLENYDDCLILMFSTDPDARHLYEINNPISRMSSMGVSIHTWDSEPILRYIQGVDSSSSLFPNPASSKFSELRKQGIQPNIEYIFIDQLDLLNSFMELVSPYIGSAQATEFRKYIGDLKKSPLNLKGDYESSIVFKRKSTSLLTYSYIMNLVYNQAGEDTYTKAKLIFDNIYLNGAEYGNPILSKLIEIINYEIKTDYITVIVHGFDVKGTENLLKAAGFENYMHEKLFVCSQSDLTLREHNLPTHSVHHVISTVSPSINYSLYFSNVSKFIFIGSPDNNTKYKNIIKNRITEIITRPIYYLSTVDIAPELLKKAILAVDIPPNDMLHEYSKEIVFEFGHIQSEGVPNKALGEANNKLKTGDNAILVVNERNQGMVIPLYTSLLIKELNRLMEFSIVNPTDRELKKLVSKEIVMDREGIFKSFKSIFLELMIMHGEKITIRKGPYEWTGFLNLYNNSIEWIELIRSAVKLYSEKQKLSDEESELKISYYLSSLGLNAKDPGYIRSWWTDYELIYSENQVLHIYRVEHPKSYDDLEKIYGGLEKLLPELKMDKDSEKTYIAAKTVQDLRRALLKGDLRSIGMDFRYLYTKMEKEIKDTVSNSTTFKVQFAFRVTILNDTDKLKIIDEYNNYVKHI